VNDKLGSIASPSAHWVTVVVGIPFSTTTTEDIMSSPTREDAQLMIQLAQWGTALGLEEATAKLFAENFDPEAADATTDPHVRKALQFGETIATLTKNDLLSTELVNDWLWIAGLWSRVGPAALKAREKAGEPRLYENFEALARS
jgi:hypothetical protein